MKVAELDKNLVIKSGITEPDMVWFDVKEDPFLIYGVMYDETEKRYVRMPQRIAETVSSGVANSNKCTAGGRVKFRTNSSYIAIKAVTCQPGFLSQMSRTGMAGFDLYRNYEDRETYFITFMPPEKWDEGFSDGTKTYGELTDYTLNLPIYNGVQELYIGLKKDAILEKANDYKLKTPIVFYGSSTTNGCSASRPGNTFPSIIARHLCSDYINLGFGGAAKGEKELAEYISGLKMSLFVMEYDSNAPSEKWLQETHYPFFKTIRDANPDVPIIMLSHEAALHGVYYETKRTSEWGTFDRRRDIIKNTYLQALKDGDKNVYFIDGKDIYRGEDWDNVTSEGCHANDFGFMRFAKYLENIIKPILSDD